MNTDAAQRPKRRGELLRERLALAAERRANQLLRAGIDPGSPIGAVLCAFHGQLTEERLDELLAGARAVVEGIRSGR